MTNMKPVAGGGAVAKVPGPANDDELGETYMVHQESAKDVADDLDDFEARLNGQQKKPVGKKPAGASAGSSKPVPKSNVPPMFVPPKHKPVKPTSMSEEQEDAMEALKAVSELDKFDKRLGGK
jgi:hypothetical protein